jgi:hypothetical protein
VSVSDEVILKSVLSDEITDYAQKLFRQRYYERQTELLHSVPEYLSENSPPEFENEGSAVSYTKGVAKSLLIDRFEEEYPVERSDTDAMKAMMRAAKGDTPDEWLDSWSYSRREFGYLNRKDQQRIIDRYYYGIHPQPGTAAAQAANRAVQHLCRVAKYFDLRFTSSLDQLVEREFDFSDQTRHVDPEPFHDDPDRPGRDRRFNRRRVLRVSQGVYVPFVAFETEYGPTPAVSYVYPEALLTTDSELFM